MVSKKQIFSSKGFLLTVYLVFLFTSILIFQISSSAKAGNEELYGTWRLISNTRTVLATGETTDAFGKSPHGFINYGRDGRMLVLIVAGERPKPPDLTKMTDQERVEAL